MDIYQFTEKMLQLAKLFEMKGIVSKAQGEKEESISPFIGKKVIVRTFSAGVFFGVLDKMSGKEAVVSSARRIWKWAGAASLSQLANEGTQKPNDCMFPAPVSYIHLTEVIEVLPLTEKAEESLRSVPIWKQ